MRLFRILFSPRGGGRRIRVAHARNEALAPAAGGCPEAPGTIRAASQGALRARGEHQLQAGPERCQRARRHLAFAAILVGEPVENFRRRQFLAVMLEAQTGHGLVE